MENTHLACQVPLPTLPPFASSMRCHPVPSFTLWPERAQGGGRGASALSVSSVPVRVSLCSAVTWTAWAQRTATTTRRRRNATHAQRRERPHAREGGGRGGGYPPGETRAYGIPPPHGQTTACTCQRQQRDASCRKERVTSADNLDQRLTCQQQQSGPKRSKRRSWRRC